MLHDSRERPAGVDLSTCYHCGAGCGKNPIVFDEKPFCCEGCQLVYDLLKESNLCTYYTLNNAPGNTFKNKGRSAKFNYLDEPAIAAKLIRFRDDNQIRITFYIPKMHCSSCIWLLENLHRLHEGIITSSVSFLKKEVTIHYRTSGIRLSEIADLLTHIGYEPLISLEDAEEKDTPRAKKKTNYSAILKIGVAGFCFGNIMMLSFPEYFSLGNFYDQGNLPVFFGFLNLLLALPVFFYSASEFFVSAGQAIRQRYLNIDAPIALAILVTFGRSVYEIVSGTGAGYLDSMTGIVFFMLIGRYIQNRTYNSLSFERDYKSYFPVAVSLVEDEHTEKSIPVNDLKKGDHIRVRNNEIIPADCVLLSKRTHVDYSFITGESIPVKKQAGDFIYAGARQADGAVDLEVRKPVSQSYLTGLWNNDDASEKENRRQQTYVDKINRYFTAIVLLLAFGAAAVWLFTDPARSLNAFTAVLIVACPCGLLLTTTFANGNMIRILGKNKLYLKNAAVLEKFSRTDTLVFDKTGTITTGTQVRFAATSDFPEAAQLAAALASQSAHPLSRKIAQTFKGETKAPVTHFEEIAGQGLKGEVNGHYLILGSRFFVTGSESPVPSRETNVFLMIDGIVAGFFSFGNEYRPGLQETLRELSDSYNLHLLSGDQDAERERLEPLFGKNAALHFRQDPAGKKDYIARLQQQGHTVLMVGDGLNDAGAFLQSDAGIAVSDDTNTFSPACDAILDGSSFTKIKSFLDFARAGKKVILVTFAVSLLYNITGLVFATGGTLSPVIAAVLMPLSSVTIVLSATLATSFIAWRKGL